MDRVNNYGNPLTAYEIPNLRFSLPAGGACERYRFVTVNATGQAIRANATANVLGVAQFGTDASHDIADQVLGIYDGIVIVEAGAAVVAGAKIASDANGCGITATAESVGVALTPAAAAGEFIACKLRV